MLTMDAPPRKKRCLASSREAEAASQGDAVLEGDHAIEEVLSDEELRPFTPREPLRCLFLYFGSFLTPTLARLCAPRHCAGGGHDPEASKRPLAVPAPACALSHLRVPLRSCSCFPARVLNKHLPMPPHAKHLKRIRRVNDAAAAEGERH